MTEYNTVKIYSQSYELAKRQAQKEELSIMEIISKAINSYVGNRKDLEERALLLIKLLDEERNHKVA